MFVNTSFLSFVKYMFVMIIILPIFPSGCLLCFEQGLTYSKTYEYTFFDCSPLVCGKYLLSVDGMYFSVSLWRL